MDDKDARERERESNSSRRNATDPRAVYIAFKRGERSRQATAWLARSRVSRQNNQQGMKTRMRCGGKKGVAFAHVNKFILFVLELLLRGTKLLVGGTNLVVLNERCA